MRTGFVTALAPAAVCCSVPAMASRLAHVVADSLDPERLGRFWSRLLRWEVVRDGNEVTVRASESEGCDIALAFRRCDEANTVKNRVHLDVASASLPEQRSHVDRALALGARIIDIGQSTVPWVVLADPDGNEFCVLEPRSQYLGSGALAAIVVDAHDPAATAAFWSAAVGWKVAAELPVIVGLRPPNGRGPWLEILRNDALELGGQRLRLRLVEDSVDAGAGRDAVASVLRLGARQCAGADVPVPPGDGVLLADPAGMEFLVLPVSAG